MGWIGSISCWQQRLQSSQLGVVREGALADLILVDGNPLENLDLVADPASNLVLIMKDGKIYKDTVRRKSDFRCAPKSDSTVCRKEKTTMKPKSALGVSWRHEERCVSPLTIRSFRVLTLAVACSVVGVITLLALSKTIRFN